MSPYGILHDLLDKYSKTVLHRRGHASQTLNPSNALTDWRLELKGYSSTNKREAKSARRPRAGPLGHCWGFFYCPTLYDQSPFGILLCTLSRIHNHLRVPKNPGFVKRPNHIILQIHIGSLRLEHPLRLHAPSLLINSHSSFKPCSRVWPPPGGILCFWG